MTQDNVERNRCIPIFSKIVSLHAESNRLSFAIPGELIGVIGPTLCRADRLVGQVLGTVGFQRCTQVRLCSVSGRKKINQGPLPSKIGSTSTGGRVLTVKGDLANIQLTSAVCTEVRETVALSRRIEKHWRFVGVFVLLSPPPPSVVLCTRVNRSLIPVRQAWEVCSGVRYWTLIDAGDLLGQCPCRVSTLFLDHTSLLYRSALTKEYC